MYEALCYKTVSLTEVEATHRAFYSVSGEALSACCRIPFICVDSNILFHTLYQRLCIVPEALWQRVRRGVFSHPLQWGSRSNLGASETL